jgi:hypothetical protein
MTDDSDTAVEPVELPEEYHQIIGMITANSAILDVTINHAIWAFLRAEPRIGRLITEPITSTSRKIKLMRSIGEILCASDPKLVKKWRETCAAIKGANSGRTKIVHAQWGFRGHDTAICVMTFEEGESKPNVELMPIKKLARYSDGIAVAQRALASFLASVKVEATTTGTHRWPPQHRAKMVRA